MSLICPVLHILSVSAYIIMMKTIRDAIVYSVSPCWINPSPFWQTRLPIN